jgi:hypothetical protein
MQKLSTLVFPIFVVSYQINFINEMKSNVDSKNPMRNRKLRLKSS